MHVCSSCKLIDEEANDDGESTQASVEPQIEQQPCDEPSQQPPVVSGPVPNVAVTLPGATEARDQNAAGSQLEQGNSMPLLEAEHEC